MAFEHRIERVGHIVRSCLGDLNLVLQQNTVASRFLGENPSEYESHPGDLPNPDNITISSVRAVKDTTQISISAVFHRPE